MTRNQMLAIVLVVLGVLTASSAQLTDLFGPMNTKIIVSGAGLLNSVFAGILAVLTGQGAQIRDVQAMPGVDKIVVNAQANPTLATMAIDPAQMKVQAAPGDSDAITQTASDAGR